MNLFDSILEKNPADTFMSWLTKNSQIPASKNSVRDIVWANTQQKPMFSGGNIEQWWQWNKWADLWFFWTRIVPKKQENRNTAPVWSNAYNIWASVETAGNAFSNYMSQGASQAQEAIKPALTNAQNYVWYITLWDKIKEKYPEYNDMSSADLWRRMFSKYPEYADIVEEWNKTSFVNSPLASTISYAGKNLIGWVNTVESWIKTYFDSLRAKDATTWFLQGTEWMINTWLWAFQTATNVLPQWQGAKVLINPLVNTFFASNEAEKVLKPINEGIDTWIKYGQEAAWFDPNSQASQSFRNIGTTAANMALMYWGQKTLWLGYDKLTGKKAPVDANSIDSMQEAPVKPYVDPNSIDSVPDVPVREYNPKTGVISNPIQKQNKAKSDAIGDKWVEEIYQAVNPTTRENKAVLRQRVNDLLPYIDETNMFNNDLPKVKERVDSDMNTAFRSMEDYEANVWVKWTVKTAQIIKALKEKYQEKIWDSYLNPDEAIAAQRVIDLLNWFGKTLKDSDIIKVRRAWDKIIKANKGFMQSADANIKGEVFNESNKFLRDEIRKSNPEYANYLDKAHKTITLSDVLEATIQRRTGQTQGGFLRQWLENVSRVVWTWIWWAIWWGAGALIWAGATEALITWTKKLTGSSAKLTRGKKLILKSWKNGTNDNNTSNSGNPSMVAKPKQLTKWPRLVEKPKKVTTPTNESKVSNTQSSTNSNSDIPEGYTKNTFGEVIKKPSNSKGGFIRNPFAKPEPKRLFAWENSAQPPSKKTGWFKWADGKMRFEIDDSGAKIKPINQYEAINGKTFQIPDILQHDELFAQYPKLKWYRVEFTNQEWTAGQIMKDPKDPAQMVIKLSKSLLSQDSKTLKSTLLHEIQHWIQDIEGFAKWWTTNSISFDIKKIDNDKISYENNLNLLSDIAEKKAIENNDVISLDKISSNNELLEFINSKNYFSDFERKLANSAKKQWEEILNFYEKKNLSNADYYKSLAWEVEARNVQTRMNMTKAERAKTSPIITEERDVPRAKQIIRMDSKWPSMSIKVPWYKQPVSEKLVEEARKYKSAEEFVKAQANTYHWTSQTFDSFSKEWLWRSTSTIAGKKWFWFTDSPTEAKAYAKMSWKSMLNDEIRIEKETNALIKKLESAEKKWDWDLADKITREIEVLDQSSRAWWLEIVMPIKIDKSKLFVYDASWKSMNQWRIDEVITKAKKEWYEWVTFKNIQDHPEDASIKTTQHIIFDEKNIKTDSELKRIWWKANNKRI